MTRGRRSWPPPTRPPCLSRPPGTWLPRRTARSRKPVPCRRLGLDHADLQHPQLDRAELQAGQRRAGWAEFQVAPMSRSAAIRLWSAASPPSAALPGCRHPTAAQPSVAAARTWQRKRGAAYCLTPPPSWPRALRAIRAWLTPGSCCSAGGNHGPKRPAAAAAWESKVQKTVFLPRYADFLALPQPLCCEMLQMVTQNPTRND